MNETVVGMSQPYTMQKLLIISVGAVLALLGTTAFIGSRHEPSTTVLLGRNDSSQPIDSQSPALGVYKATPYTMIVVVPKMRLEPLMPPNKSLQATRDGRSSSASRFTLVGPACLSSGR